MVLRNPLVALPFRTNTEVSENTRVTLKSRQHAYHTPHAHPYYNYLKYFTIFSRWPHIIDKGFAHIRRNWVLLKFYKVWFTELCFHDVKNQEKWNGYGSYFLCYINDKGMMLLSFTWLCRSVRWLLDWVLAVHHQTTLWFYPTPSDTKFCSVQKLNQLKWGHLRQSDV